MKLTSINAENILGIRAASVALTSTITLFAGPNGQGKTSLAEAVRMALDGNIVARGVKLKKDLAALVHEGAKAGSIEVQHDTGLVTFALVPSGKATPAEAYTAPAALPFVLEPQRFAALEPNERRSMLFSLMGLSITPKDVIKRLADAGVDPTKAERVGPLLRAGFDAACTEAKRKATEAKGAWRAVTGETYGSEKAKGWTAPVPAHNEVAAKALATELQHCEVALESWQQTIGRAQAEEQRRAALREKLPGLQELAGKVDRIETKLAADRESLAAAEQALQQAQAMAGTGQRVGLIHELAWAASYLVFFGDSLGDSPEDQRVQAAIDEYSKAHGKISFGNEAGDPAAAARLPELTASRDLMDRAVANSQRDLAAALRARDEITEIEQSLAGTQEQDAPALAEARTQAEQLKATRAELVKKLDTHRAQKAAADAAEKKTAEAATHHADVVAWDLIAAELAPDGIPGRMLAEALEPFNQRLAQSASDAEWLRIGVNTDMSITTADQRPYKLLSESEQWRADAMLAEAISHLSGLKLLMLDRFDVLDLKGRADLLAWLEILATEGELETALLFGTLKSIPADLPACVSAHWLQGGQLQQLREAA